MDGFGSIDLSCFEALARSVWRRRLSGLRRSRGKAVIERKQWRHACRRGNHRCIKVGTAQLRIDTGSENIDIKSPGTTQHKAGDRGAAKNMDRNCFTRRTSVLVCREAKRTGTRTHSACAQTSSTLFLSMPSPEKLQWSISQRRGASLRRFLVKCGLRAGSYWATGIFKARMTPMRANIVGPPDVATRINASIAACHSAASCLAFGSLVMYLPASSRVTSWRLRGSDIGSSNLRFHPRRSATDGLAQPLHRELEVLRLEMAPAFYLGLELLLEVSLEIFPYRLPGRPSAPS